MDHEMIDAAAERASAKRAQTDQGGPEAGLHSKVGNRAFAQLVQRAAPTRQGAGPLDPQIAENIKHQRGGGEALDDDTRADMEAHLGADLSGVRVHTGSGADSLSRSVGAEAFTTGQDVFFKSGKFTPESTDGRRLLAHELTHVVQQTSGRAGGESRVSHPDDPHEVEARAVGDAVASSSPASVDRAGEEPEEEMAEEEVGASVDRADQEPEEAEAGV